MSINYNTTPPYYQLLKLHSIIFIIRYRIVTIRPVLCEKKDLINDPTEEVRYSNDQLFKKNNSWR